MVDQVMEAELFSGFHLGTLTRSDRIEEMEFSFPLALSNYKTSLIYFRKIHLISLPFQSFKNCMGED